MKNLNLEKFKEVLEKGKTKLIATGLAGVMTISMVGCSKPKEEPTVEQPSVSTEEPAIESPKEEIVDPNAPLFDITDEEVFNQKVDELYAEIEGKSAKSVLDGQTLMTITKKEQAEFFVIMLNINSASSEQIDFLNNYVPISNDLNADLANTFGIIHDNNIDITRYISSPSKIDFTNKINKIRIATINGQELTDDDKQFLNQTCDAMLSDIDYGTGDSVYNYCLYHTLYCLSINDYLQGEDGFLVQLFAKVNEEGMVENSFKPAEDVYNELNVLSSNRTLYLK